MYSVLLHGCLPYRMNCLIFTLMRIQSVTQGRVELPCYGKFHGEGLRSSFKIASRVQVTTNFAFSGSCSRDNDVIRTINFLF